MSIPQIINKSKEIFTKFEKLSDCLYKGHYEINNKLAGIYFLNFSESITKKDFDEIQYKYLAEEFYKNEDSLQWNIYLLFINSIIEKELKSRILTNDKYARKLFFQENDFFDYFELEKSSPTSLPNLVSEWKKELLAVDLQEVYGNISYAQAVQDFLTNSTHKENFESVTPSISEVLKIEKVNRIELGDTFRKYPSQRNFSFGVVNLINGVNGSGKTSLLEAIELLLTGKANRNPETPEAADSIKGLVNGSIHDNYTPHNTRKYKERDVKWYNRNYQLRGNSCQVAFNQFNFFNSDAAYQFASSMHEDQINESLKQIILGPEYAFLRDRIQGFEKRLRPEFNGLNRKISEQEEQIKKLSILAEDLKSTKNLTEIQERIAENVSALKYKDHFSTKDYSISSLHLNDLKTHIKYILNQNIAFNNNDFVVLSTKIKEQLAIVASAKNEYSERSNQKIEIIGRQKSLEAKRDQIAKLLRYFIVDDIKNIENIEEQYRVIKSRLAKLENIKIELSKLDIDAFLQEGACFKDLKRIKSENSLKVSMEIKDLEAELKLLNNNFSTIEDILNKIKLLGKDFLFHHKDSEECPLCQQKILHSQLASRLERDFEASIDKSILNDKSEKLSVLKYREKKILSDIDILDKLECIIKGEISSYEDFTINEIAIKVNSILSEVQLLSHKKSKIEATYVQIASIGSISEYLSLKEIVGSNLNTGSPFEISTFKSLLSRIDAEIKVTNEAIEKKDKENYVLIAELNKSLQFRDFISDISAIQTSVTSQSESISSLGNSFMAIKACLNISDDKSIMELSKELSVLEENLNSLTESQNKQNELKRILKELEAAQFFINENTPKLDRLSKAIEVLQRLEENDGENALYDYFKSNLKEIKDIFKTIHAPQEFTDLKFEDKRLTLYKGEIKYAISQISSGQRAALAISIFISLNRKLKDGPNILIFDDPVTFIDDFNALSFLDFLRYFTVKENKQIFFATANKKFSTLFKKKFEFLEDGYKEFELTRT